MQELQDKFQRNNLLQSQLVCTSSPSYLKVITKQEVWRQLQEQMCKIADYNLINKHKLITLV